MITCKFENNKVALLRHVTVGVIATNKNGQILLVKRAPNLLRGNKYTIPGGFLDRDENIQHGGLRELYEETGIRGKHATLFRINSSPDRPKEDRQNVDFIYIVSGLDGTLIENKEVTEIKWFSEDNLPQEDNFAFDHRESILLYFKFIKKHFLLPIIN